MRCLSTTAGSDKHQARPPTDHFKWLLEEAYPNHIYPIKHKLKDCGMMRIFMTSGSLTWGEELNEGPDRSDTTPFPEEKAIMSASIQNSSSSAAVDKDVIREDSSSALPNTKSRTCTAEVRRASSSAFASRHIAGSALSYLAANRARPDGNPRSRTQIFTVGRLSRDRRSSIFWNLAASPSTTTTRKVSLGERPSTDSMAEATVA
jgi:hypothetical protein